MNRVVSGAKVHGTAFVRIEFWVHLRYGAREGYWLVGCMGRRLSQRQRLYTLRK